MTALSPLRQKRFEHLFRVNDRDGDGFITEADVMPTATRFADSQGWSADEPRRLQHAATLAAVWKSYEGFSRPEDGPRMRLDAWMTLWTGYTAALAHDVAQGGGPLLHQLEQSLEQVIDLLDDTHSGRATRDIWCAWARAANVADPEAAFARLDVQGKGYLLRADLVQLQVEFLVSEDPDAPGNHYFGVLDTRDLATASTQG
ncbi:MAG: hypothetical protein U0325_32610 [Polyangiales bacterium]